VIRTKEGKDRKKRRGEDLVTNDKLENKIGTLSLLRRACSYSREVVNKISEDYYKACEEITSSSTPLLPYLYYRYSGIFITFSIARNSLASTTLLRPHKVEDHFNIRYAIREIREISTFSLAPLSLWSTE
jgi:hypothetical protein